MHKKLTENKAYAQCMSRLRTSTVEPVLGTLINFLNMKRVNTRGIELANKHILMSALTYNLKKYLKFVSRKTVSKATAMQTQLQTVFSASFLVFWLLLRRFKPVFFGIENHRPKNNLSTEWMY
jgi:hypothetical protein